MKYFISSDIHSYYDLWMEQLNIKGYNKDNPDHFLIVCGDLFDRGPDPIKCLQFVNSIPNDKKALIRGNHEDLLINVLHKCRLDYYDYRNGTEATVNSLINYMVEKTNCKVDNFFSILYNPGHFGVFMLICPSIISKYNLSKLHTTPFISSNRKSLKKKPAKHPPMIKMNPTTAIENAIFLT